MSIGRPRKTIKTKRIQAVIPEEILNKLDKKVSGDKNLDRSKALTEAVNEWLGLTKKKRSFENIYKKFFGYNGATKEELFSDKIIDNNSEESKITKLILERLFEDRRLLSKEVEEINNFISKQTFFIDNKLRLHCNSEKLLEVLKKLFLNSQFPINNYIGHCSFCGKEFFKKKVSQKYDTPICKIHNLEKRKSETSNIKEAVHLKQKIESIKKDSKFDIKEYLDINSEYSFEKIKKLIEDICYKADFKYSGFKKNFKKLLNDNYELEGFGNLFNIYMAHLIKTYDSETIKKLEYENFGDFFAEDVFPDKKDIRSFVSKDIKDLISKNSFEKRKDYILVSIEIAKLPDELQERAWLEVGNKFLMPEESEILNNQKIPDIFKKNIINSIKLLKAFASKKYHPEASIEICENILKENENNIKAMELLIDTYFSMGPSKYKEVIYYYNKIEETENKLREIEDKIGKTYDPTDITQKELIKEKLSFTNHLPGMQFSELINPRHIEAISAFAAAIEGDCLMSLDLLRDEFLDNLNKLKEQGEPIPDNILNYPEQDRLFVMGARAISILTLSKNENLMKKANEIKDAFLNQNFDLFEKDIIAFEKIPEITKNIEKK